nr:MAG: glycogen debranching protein [Pseudomonadota bacterium]
MTVLDIELPDVADAEAWRNREWLVTNGLGGYASGTLAGVCTRRYHGVFVPNLQRPRGRHVLVSRLDEEIHCAGGVCRLGGSDHIGRPLDPGNAPYLESFRLEGNMACWTFRCGDVTLTRQLVMPHQRNATLLRYEVTSGPPTMVRIRPFLPFRRQDAPLRQPGHGPFELAVEEDGSCRVGLAGSELWMAMRMLPVCAPFIPESVEVPDAGLWREQVRGYASHEALSSPGYFQWEAKPGEPVVLVFTTEEMHPRGHALRTFDEERRRSQELVRAAGAGHDPFLARLAVAADQFLILPENRLDESTEAARHGHALRTVVAGYHWFLDWGRDTMIALEGLMLATGRHGEARAPLLTFAHYVRDGLLPNLFPEGSRLGAYHTADATLWYFHAINRYVKASGDVGVFDELMPVLRDILRHHLKGTRFGIGIDEEDCLLRAGTPGHALTWMDAHMGDWIVTPRRGKPVEIQALWYNALCLMAEWEGAAGESWLAIARQVRDSFNRKFWNPARNCLFDVVDGEEGNNARLRPNQLFAISLDHPVLERRRWPAVLEVVAGALLTPVGLRTLEESDPEYARNYHGNLAARDAAYHQGTVWPWLLGAWVDAWLKTWEDPAAARRMLAAFPAHLQVAGLGTISEVFDGEPPHAPHGCIAQAWSVAEVLRCWKRTASGGGPAG